MRAPKGKGLFVWKLYNCGPTESVIARCRAHDLGHLAVKFADGRQDHATGEPSYHPSIRNLVPRARDAGIEVWGWPYLYGNDPAGEARAQAEWFKELELDGFIIDAEQEYKNRHAPAHKYARTLRAELPTATIALSSYMWPSYHGELPWDEFMEVCDIAMPQVYWWGRNPVATLRRSISEFSRWAKPIVPTGAACDGSGHRITAEDMKAFAAAAWAQGCPSINFWYWEGASTQHWKALKQITPPSPTQFKVVRIDAEGVPGVVIDCHPAEENGVTRCDLRALADSLGWTVHYVNTPQGPRAYLKPGA